MKLALSIIWFVVGLVGYVAAGLTYGLRASPVFHGWYIAAWLVLASWMLVGTRVLHGRGGRRAP